MTSLKKKSISIVLAVLVLGLMGFATDRYFAITKYLSIFTKLYKEVNAYYVEEVNPNTLMETSIEAMLLSLDPYTNYISADRIEDYRTLNTGQYGGIGASTVRIEDKIYISMFFEGSPAQASDLQIGDHVSHINGVNIVGKPRDEIDALMKGQNETSVVLTIERYDVSEPFDVEINRDRITIDNVPYYGLVDDTNGYIKLSEFTQNASANVKEALQELKEQGAEGIILDLRDNPGGLLVEAVNISNLFIPKGSPVVSTKGKIEENNTDYRAMFDPVDTDIPIVVLINSSSASASEIVAGVMQDYDRGVLVGEKSYGKGLVQTTRRLSYNAQLKVTTAKYYIPSGRCIQAIDYSSRRPDGSVGKVPDSLIARFNTANGRTVFDGGGVDPDVFVNGDELPSAVEQLIRRGLIFQYATVFRTENETIEEPGTFVLSKEQYEAFTEWVKKQGFSYKTAAEKDLERIKKVAKEHRMWGQIRDAHNALAVQIQEEKARDMRRYGYLIRPLLERQIVGRYYYQKGVIESSFDDDRFVREAAAILNQPDHYSRLLR